MATDANPRPTLYARSSDDRMIAGVAAGIAHRVGVDPLSVRAAFAVLTLAGGLGVLLYLLALLLAGAATGEEPTVVAKPRERAMAVMCFTGAVALLMRRSGLWIGDALAWPLLLIIGGSVVVWIRQPRSGADAERLQRLARTTSVPRAVVGLALVFGGLVTFVITVHSLRGIGALLGAIATVVVGAAVISGPFVSRLTTELADERRRRIRTTERAEMSAHLHDSVLQTLALIQRHADDPRVTAQLARRQERELRAWLLGVPNEAARTLRSAISGVIEQVEDDYAIRVDLVHTGDTDIELDEPVEAIVGAIREAVINASKHASVAEVSVFVEATRTAVNAFIRDRGCGFDQASVPADRRGLADSIIGRLQRNGGSAHIDSQIGVGTEITLTLPRQVGVGR